MPVTVGGAVMPAVTDLPDALKGLADWQGRELRDGDTWNGDMQLLVRRIANELGRNPRQFKRWVTVAGAGVALLGVVGAGTIYFSYRSTPKGTEAAPADIVIFDNTNRLDVRNSPPERTFFTITRPYVITSVITYHWNNRHGSPPGKIGFRASDGKVFGPWEAGSVPREDDVKNTSWVVKPEITLEADTYEIIDSERETWSFNEKSKGAGFAFIQGHLR